MSHRKSYEQQKSETRDLLIKHILDALKSHDFAEWYAASGKFTAFIRGGSEMKEVFNTENHLEVEILIKQDIRELFNLG